MELTLGTPGGRGGGVEGGKWEEDEDGGADGIAFT
jgi:hypothetical protein